MGKKKDKKKEKKKASIKQSKKLIKDIFDRVYQGSPLGGVSIIIQPIPAEDIVDSKKEEVFISVEQLKD